MKKDGGIIKNWQMHTISKDPEFLAKEKKFNTDFEMDAVMVFTGTIVEDPTGRWKPGFHMRSSLILNYDKETGIVETANTIYKLDGEMGGDVFGDMGPDALKIFY